jgi:hypothetical protein
MKGQIAISKINVRYNKMGWNIFDFFKFELRYWSTSPRAGWYAYILRDGIYYFLWSDNDYHPSQKYLDSLKKDGWILSHPIDMRTISAAFN